MANKQAPRANRSARRIGGALGLLITLGLLGAVFSDYRVRVEAARRQSVAVAAGVSRLIHYELRNLERALNGIAADADTYAQSVPEQWVPLVDKAVEGVVERHGEIESILLYGSDGEAVSAGVTDPVVRAWVRTLQIPQDHSLRFGPLHSVKPGEQVVPLALSTDAGYWIVCRIRTTEFLRMLTGLDVGTEGGVGILNMMGTVLARSGNHQNYVGRTVPLPASLEKNGATTLEVTSALDGVTRFVTYNRASGYPLVAAAGLARDEALAPWYRFMAAAVALVLMYWLGMLYLARHASRAQHARSQAIADLRTHARWLEQAQHASRLGVWAIEGEQAQVRASAEALTLFGLDAPDGLVPIDQFFERIHPEERDSVRQEFAQARDDGRPFEAEYRVLLPEGRARWISASGAFVPDGEGRRMMTGTVVDVTDRRAALLRIERAEQQFRDLFELNPLPFWVFDQITLQFLAVNRAAEASYGYSREEFLSMSILDIRPAQDHADVMASVDAPLEPRDASKIWRHVKRDGSAIHVKVHSSSIQFAGRPGRLVLAEDVSERIRHEEELAWRAAHDPGTGLLNLASLASRLDSIECTPRQHYAVIHLQLRDLELVAPTWGWRASEAIIKQVAARFGATAEPFGYAAFAPSDAFVFATLDARNCEELVRALMSAMESPVEHEGSQHRIAAWIGTSICTDHQTAEHVIGQAALAAVHARRENLRQVEYRDEMADEAAVRLALVRRLRDALRRDEFTLHFQPIVSAADSRIVAVEALLRWHPEGGPVSPAEFIPLAEKAGLIGAIGTWVLEEAARSFRILAAHGHGNLSVAVNVSAIQVASGELPDALRMLIERQELPSHALQVEITESAVLRRPEIARAVIENVRRLGICVSIDDFGTGYSSMAQLRDIPLDHLKIDRSFVQDVEQEGRSASICRSLIQLAHGLGLGVIAEGVETETQAAWLRAEGCDMLQGYHFARPMPLDALLAHVDGASG